MSTTPSRTSSIRMSVLPDSKTGGGIQINPQDFIGAVSSVTQETYESLSSIWREAGYEEVECQSLLGDILTKIKSLCATELSAEKQILDHAKKQVEVKMMEYASLGEKLGRACGGVEEFGDNFADRLAELEKRIYDINIEISGRNKIISAKLNEINSLTALLGEEGPHLFEGSELSDQRLENMTAHVTLLENIKNKRIIEFREVAENCLKAMTDLVVPLEGVDNLPQAVKYSDLDQAVLKLKPEVEFPFLHRSDLTRLVERLQSLCQEKEKRRLELANNGAEIARMWTQLRVPTADREMFQRSFSLNLSMETVKKGRAELARLKELRLSSLEAVISCIRDEMSAYWTELGVTSEEQREAEFPMFGAPIKTLPDSSVEDHESFCQTLREKVEILRPILSKIAKRESIVLERVELEHIMLDPERLRARGPKAREDRKREEEMQRRVKGLEKYTKELLLQIEQWEEQSGGTPFLYSGLRYVERVNAQEEEYDEIKNNLRNARRKKDGKPETASTPKTNGKKFSSTLPSSSNSNAALSGTTPVLKKQTSTLSTVTPVYSTPGGGSGIPVMSKMKSLSAVKPVSSKHVAQENEALISNIENIPHQQRNSSSDRGSFSSISSESSQETMQTSATEIKERPSQATVVRNDETY